MLLCVVMVVTTSLVMQSCCHLFITKWFVVHREATRGHALSSLSRIKIDLKFLLVLFAYIKHFVPHANLGIHCTCKICESDKNAFYASLAKSSLGSMAPLCFKSARALGLRMKVL